MKLTKQNTRIILCSALLTLLLVLIFQNSRQVALSFITVHVQLPLFLVIAISALVGYAIGRLLKGRR